MPAYALEIIVFSLGLAMLLVETFVKLEDKRSLASLGLLGLVVAFGLLFKIEPHAAGDTNAFWNFYSDSRMSLYYKGIAILATILVLVMGVDYRGVVEALTAPAEKKAHPQAGLGEFFALPVFACAGLMCMASATNLVSIFVSLEAVTITFYVLVAYLRRNVGSLEAGVKYLILGALSTGFLVYGFAWLYGVTGSMDLAAIGAKLQSGTVNQTAALFAFALILVALGFKVGAVPFQMWIPDVYQGAPTPVTAFLSVGSKAAGFIVLLRVADAYLGSEMFGDRVVMAFGIIAGLTLIFGNLTAIPQTNFKRLLAYSSIAHAGFLLTAVSASPKTLAPGQFSSAQVVSFYLGAYLLMTLLAFLVVGLVRVHRHSEELDAYRGLGKSSPFLALALLISMASLAGVPLTAGFFGKFFVFTLAIQQGMWCLVTIAAIGAGAGFYYYLKVVAEMYWNEPAAASETNSPIPVSPLTRTAIVVLIFLILLAGVAPRVIFGLIG